jgi:HAD superfamily hydrolase (TIGR01509 family)
MDLRAFAAVCFDFDGTLADNFDAIAAAVNHVRTARRLEPLSTSNVKRFVGRGIDYLVANTVGGDVPAGIADYRAFFPKVMREGTTLLPGAAEALSHLYKAGKKQALCSNKLSQYSRELLRYLKVDDFFSCVLGPEDVGRAKPAPDMLLAAMKNLGVSAAQTLYIGDMVVDIETARAADVTVWVVPTGTDSRETLLDARPDRLLESLFELANNHPPARAGR